MANLDINEGIRDSVAGAAGVLRDGDPLHPQYTRYRGEGRSSSFTSFTTYTNKKSNKQNFIDL